MPVKKVTSTKQTNPISVVKRRRDLIYTLVVENKSTVDEIHQALLDAGFTTNRVNTKKDMEIVNKMIRETLPEQSKEALLEETIATLKRLAKAAEGDKQYKVSADIHLNIIKITGAYVPAPKTIEQTINNTQNINGGLSLAELQALPREIRQGILQAKNNTLTLSAKED